MSLSMYEGLNLHWHHRRCRWMLFWIVSVLRLFGQQEYQWWFFGNYMIFLSCRFRVFPCGLFFSFLFLWVQLIWALKKKSRDNHLVKREGNLWGCVFGDQIFLLNYRYVFRLEMEAPYFALPYPYFLLRYHLLCRRFSLFHRAISRGTGHYVRQKQRARQKGIECRWFFFPVKQKKYVLRYDSPR